MAVKVYIQFYGEKNGGTYEIEKFPIEKEAGLIEARYTPTKGKNAGTKKPMQIGITSIARIEPVTNEAGEVEESPDFGNLPE